MTRWFHPLFENDLTAAALYYEQQRNGLGAEFLDASEQAVEIVAAAPRRWPARSGGIRRFLIERFPYVIRYRLSPSGDVIEFLSVIHGARHPDIGQERA